MSYRDTSVPDRGAYMKSECEREPGPGVLAYVDGEDPESAGGTAG
jgi:hypothetical protein